MQKFHFVEVIYLLRVVFPWSTWAITAIFFIFCIKYFLNLFEEELYQKEFSIIAFLKIVGV